MLDWVLLMLVAGKEVAVHDFRYGQDCAYVIMRYPTKDHSKISCSYTGDKEPQVVAGWKMQLDAARAQYKSQVALFRK